MALAGAVSNLNFTWLDGIDETMGVSKTVEDDGAPSRQSAGARGSWRAHMNAIQAIVDQGLESALIMEDDIDWDVRLKSQMRSFSTAVRAWLSRTEPSAWSQGHKETAQEVADRVTTPIPFFPVADKNRSPYGSGWDVLWLGHCGTEFPSSHQSQRRISIPDDTTVPAPRHLKPHPFALNDPLGELYPPHTRVVHASSGTVCTLAYAVSRRGAKRLQQQFGPAAFTKQWDLALGDWCDDGTESSETGAGPAGDHAGNGEDETGNRPLCLTVQPPIVNHYHAQGGSSDILGQGGGYVRKVGSPYVRLSVRLNLARILRGWAVEDLADQFPDEGGSA
ncbi:hypothetical protein JX265_004216 [Neoarthrinium moseri]|uniref:Glycosyltransferase family 25 protein n=1 Tax=Neoarthrinium moseri TaxID=1658444 RepID=A0A9Q0ARE0_9PEZI|nr:hypothetical protein JX265_004216 [Neoarthrinium moseri]